MNLVLLLLLPRRLGNEMFTTRVSTAEKKEEEEKKKRNSPLSLYGLKVARGGGRRGTAIDVRSPSSRRTPRKKYGRIITSFAVAPFALRVERGVVNSTSLPTPPSFLPPSPFLRFEQRFSSPPDRVKFLSDPRSSPSL